MTETTYSEIVLSSPTTWAKHDTLWMLGLYGTAIGAGTLFLPITAGLNGIIPLLCMALIAFPMTYVSHQGLCRFILSGRTNDSDITKVVTEHFGSTFGDLITWLYFFTIYPILLMYSVALTNTTESFLINQLHLISPSRIVLAPCLVALLMFVVHFGQKIIISSMNVLVYPFIISLLFVSIYLIPHWNSAIFHFQPLNNPNVPSLWMTLWLMIPVLIFSFSHLPIISSFAVAQKKRFSDNAVLTEQRCSKILKYSHMMMVLTVMFFVFSCVLSLTPNDLALAKAQNISILSYLANHFQSPIIAWFAPIIALVAIAKSFLGHYLGAKEGLHHLLSRSLKQHQGTSVYQAIPLMIELFVATTCSIVAIINPSILNMIERLGGPILAIMLFILPAYAIRTLPSMKSYQAIKTELLMIIIGLLGISAILYGLW